MQQQLVYPAPPPAADSCPLLPLRRLSPPPATTGNRKGIVINAQPSWLLLLGDMEPFSFRGKHGFESTLKMRKAVVVRFIGRSIFVNGVWERAWCQLKITAGQARRQFSVRNDRVHHRRTSCQAAPRGKALLFRSLRRINGVQRMPNLVRVEELES